MKLAVASDELVPLTDHVVQWLREHGHEIVLGGALVAGQPTAWPIAAVDLAASGACVQGVLFCYTGTGASIAANKVPGVRAALCADAPTVEGARRWNHANVLVLSYRATTATIADEILTAWFATPPGTGEDAALVAQLAAIERKYARQDAPEP
jgi:ribose 5-phosphate isomerase B